MRAIHRHNNRRSAIVRRKVSRYRNSAPAIAVREDGMIYDDSYGGGSVPIIVNSGSSGEIPITEVPADAILYITPKEPIADNPSLIQVLVNDPVTLPEVQARVAIAKEVLPEVFYYGNTELQNQEILSSAKAEAITVIKETQPEASLSYLQGINNVVELLQMAALVQDAPEIPIAQIQQMVQEETEEVVTSTIRTGEYIAPKQPQTIVEKVQTVILPDTTLYITPKYVEEPVTTVTQKQETVITPKTQEIINTVGSQLGLLPAGSLAAPVRDRTSLYLAGGVAVIGILALLFKK